MRAAASASAARPCARLPRKTPAWPASSVGERLSTPSSETSGAPEIPPVAADAEKMYVEEEVVREKIKREKEDRRVLW